MKHTIYALTMFALAACTSPQEEAIDRHALVTRNNPEVTAMDSLSSPVGRKRRICLHGRCYRIADFSRSL